MHAHIKIVPTGAQVLLPLFILPRFFSTARFDCGRLEPYAPAAGSGDKPAGHAGAGAEGEPAGGAGAVPATEGAST